MQYCYKLFDKTTRLFLFCKPKNLFLNSYLLQQSLMPSTRRQKAKARRSREMDMMSDYDNLDVMLGSENNNPIEREN